jgi:ABC-2 type transport system permease protein
VIAAWRAELLKISTVRGLWLCALLAAIAIPATSLLVAATGGLGTRDTATSGAAAGSLIGLLAFGAWGATFAAGEYAQHTMIVSLASVPRRAVLYAAKLAATATAAAMGAVVAAAVALLTVLAVTPRGEHHLGNPGALVGVVLAVVAVAVCGAAVGMLTRSVSASIGIVALALLLPKAAGGLLGGLQRWVVGASPGTVVTQIVGGAQLPVEQAYPRGGWAAAATMVLAAAFVCVAGFVTFLRRDG